MIIRSIGHRVPGWHGPPPGGGHTGITSNLDAAVLQQATWLEATYHGDVEVRFNADRRCGGAYLMDPVLNTTTIGLWVATGSPNRHEELLHGASIPGYLRALRVTGAPPPHRPHWDNVWRTANDETHARQVLQALHAHPVYAAQGARIAEQDLRYGDIVIAGEGYSDLKGSIVWRPVPNGIVLQHKDAADALATAPSGTVRRILRGLVVHDVRPAPSAAAKPRRKGVRQ